MISATAHAPVGRGSQPLQASGIAIQRKCVCSRGRGGECAECRTRRRWLGPQRLLRQMQSAPPAESTAVDPAAPDVVHRVLRRPGHRLDARTRTFMEGRFGRDFSAVRLHTDAEAARSARAVQARAYTVGRHVVFGTGAYSPGSQAGRHLLAHELTHVVQQGRGRGPVLQRQAARPSGGRRAPAAATAGECMEEIVGDQHESIFEPNTLAFVEFGAEWCGPCHILKAYLTSICEQYRAHPPPVHLRFYTVDIDRPENEALERQYATGGIPQLYVYFGRQLKLHHRTVAGSPEIYEQLVARLIADVSTSAAVKGARSGAIWGTVIGGLLGIGGAIALAATGALTGNLLMLGILGSVLGGAGVGAGLGAGIGALARWLSEEDEMAAGTGGRPGPRSATLRRKAVAPVAEDACEREADRVADRVMRMPGPAPAVSRGRGARREVAQPEAAPVRAASSAAGRPLPSGVRRSLEPRFGHNFGHVRVHTDAAASRLTHRHGAAALTLGSNIYFAPGVYAPARPMGQAVLGHELAHVIQGETGAAHAAEGSLEAEATGAALRVAVGEPAPVRLSAPARPLAITRTEQTLLGLGLGLLAGAALGALAGLGIAAAAGLSLGAGAGIGALIGGVVGGLTGTLLGYLLRRTRPVEPDEADELIRGRYGEHLQAAIAEGVSARDADIRVVPVAAFCAAYRLKHPESGDRCLSLDAWVDRDTRPRRIWIREDRQSPGLIVHEALHLYSSHEFHEAARNEATEGITEYFTRQILDQVNIAHHGGYARQHAEVVALVALVGEDVLRRAYFAGHTEALICALDEKRGRGAFDSWWCNMQLRSWEYARACVSGDGCRPCPVSGYTAGGCSRLDTARRRREPTAVGGAV